jgi:hypothetical protein
MTEQSTAPGRGSVAVPPWAPAPWQAGPFPAHTWAAPPTRPGHGVRRQNWAATISVAAAIAAVVFGGLLADGAVAAPSAGTVAVSGPVRITAAPGWIVSESAGAISDGVALQDSSALLVAQVVSTEYAGDEQRLLADAEESYRTDMGQITFGRSRTVKLGGKQASEVTFSALVSSAGSSGVIDGELICMVIESGGSSYAVLIQVGVPQGYLDTVSAAVEEMAASVEVAP